MPAGCAGLSPNAAKGAGPLIVAVSRLPADRLRRGLHVPDDALVTLLANDPVVWQQTHRDWPRRLYGLTPSQSHLAELLASGSSLKEAARRLGIAEGSARQYLKIIFRKTGTNRQADLRPQAQRPPHGPSQLGRSGTTSRCRLTGQDGSESAMQSGQVRVRALLCLRKSGIDKLT